MGTPTRFPSGVTNVAKSASLGMFTAPDPSKNHVYFNDFDTYVAGDWTVTSAGTISAAAIADVDGGAITLTTDAGANDNVFLDKKGESFLLALGKKAWFKCRFKADSATNSKIVIGLQITDTTPLAVTDGVYFYKAGGATAITLEVVKNSTSTSSAVGVLADATFTELAWYFNGVDGISFFQDGVQIGTSAITNMVDDEELTVSIGFQNGSSASHVMTVDYVFAAKER